MPRTPERGSRFKGCSHIPCMVALSSAGGGVTVEEDLLDNYTESLWWKI